MRGGFDDLVEAFEELREGDVVDMVKGMLEAEVPATDILVKGLIPGLDRIGERFERMEYFIMDLLFAADIMDESMKLLSPLLEREGVEGVSAKGKLVIGTVKGDLHDIGKNIFITLMKAAGFKVIDLGVDVPEERFVEMVEGEKPDIGGMSALLSITAPYFKVVIDALKEAGLREKVFVMIGGPQLVTAEEVGADVYCDDA